MAHEPIPETIIQVEPSKIKAEDLRKDRLTDASSIKKEILRGAKMRNVVSGDGVLWRKSPIDLDENGRKELFKHSEEVPSLKYFLSHTWATAGWQKYLALLLHSGLDVSLIGMVIALIICFILGVTNVLPSVQGYPVKIEQWNFEGALPLSPWCTWFPPIVGAVLLYVSPKFPQLTKKHFGRDDHAFFDVVCINQSDKDMQLEGIYSLAAFLSHTKEMVIMWSPPYFTRLWCVYEIAAFFSLTKDCIVRLSPLFVDVVVCVLFGYNFFTQSMMISGFLFNQVTEEARDDGRNEQINVLMSLIIMGPLIHKVRSMMREKKELATQLRNFEVDKAGTRDEEDRKFIAASIDKWYGGASNFNEFVRTSVCDDVLSIMKGESVVAYKFLVWAGFPTTCLNFDFFTGYIRVVGSGGSLSTLYLITWAVYCSIEALCAAPLRLRFMFYLTERCNAKCGNACLDYMLTFLVLLVYVLITMGSVGFSMATIVFLPWAARLIWWFIVVSVTCWVFRPCRKEKSVRTSGKSESPKAMLVGSAKIAEDSIATATAIGA